MGWLSEWFRLGDMELVQLLRREEPALGWLALIAVFTGMVNAALLVILHQSAEYYGTGGVSLRFFVLFALAVAMYLYSRHHLQMRSAGVVDRVVEQMRIRVSQKVRQTGLLSLQGLTQSRIHQALAEGGELIGNGTGHLARAVTAAIMIGCSFAYVAVFSRAAFFISLLFLAGMFLAGAHLTKQARAQFALFRGLEGDFLATFQHLLDGFQEVKLHRGRGDDLVEGSLARIARDVRTRSIDSHRQTAWTDVTMGLIFWGLFAANVFLLPQYDHMPPAILLTITMILLFIFGNLENFVTSAPIVTKANVAIRTLQELEARLEAQDDESATVPASALAAKTSFGEIALSGIRFRYPDAAEERSFALGPIDLTLKAGETLFLCGGNGSGKSTLLRTLTMLYVPGEGEIRIDGVRIDDGNRVHYRNLFSSVMSDFHLFDRLYGLRDVPRERFDAVLAKVEMSGRVALVDGSFSTLELSSGQKKRLALAVALLEDRPILVLDEVAADLDPQFRRRYYEEFLPELQRQGKTLILGTHDDRWFGSCDRLLTMADGRIAASETPRRG